MQNDYSPRAEPSEYSIEDLLYLMARLRDPVNGCPWDLKQTYRTIAPSTLEEAYEVVDAIERGDYVHLREELGDLLFQAVFYSQLATEDNLFRFADIIHVLVTKLIRRHPHVFPDGRLYSVVQTNPSTDTQVKQNWEAIKEAERQEKGMHNLLADIPVALPAVTRAAKLQKRAAQVGFDWPDVSGVLEKLQEEISELQKAMVEGSITAVESELGDVLFTCVNLSRHLRVEPESALRRANAKFVERFEAIEKRAKQEGVLLENLAPGELDALWIWAKSQ